MWDGLFMLLLLSLIMGGASFLAGIVPLSLSLSSKQLRMITALGTGVLVGTSLIVIIPEGVETLYKSSGASHGHDRRGPSIRADEHEAGHDDVHREPHAWIGMSLTLGFILMYLIDTLPQSTSTHSQPQSFPISLNQFSFNFAQSRASEDMATPPAESAQSRPAAPRDSHGSRPSSTTIGLVIHAAADGIALGASSTNSSSNLSFIIFLALMIHKAPAAFGLTTVLLKQGLSVRMARMHLIIFSLAAPVGALLTWSAIHILGFTSGSLGGSASSEFATGVLLLFSGGTFLYVAMHTMQAAGANEHSRAQGHDMNEYAGVPMDDPYSAHVSTATQPQGPALLDTLVTVGGMLLPLLTQVGHAH